MGYRDHGRGPGVWPVHLPANRPGVNAQDAQSGLARPVLLIYLACEVGLVVVLSRASTGAWINYGIQATVFASVLAARAFARSLSEPLTRRRAVPIVVATLTLLIGVCGDVRLSATRRLAERQAVDRLFEHFKRPPKEFFFTDRPGVNRTYGRVELVFDDWLYPVFEAIHLAQNRSTWLASALMSGETQFIVNKSGSPEIEGLGLSMSQLGFVSDSKLGDDFFVWRRIPFERTRGTD